MEPRYRGQWKSDTTKDVIQTRGASLPLTYIFETTPGKNAALNGGLALVSGDLIVLSDDDAVLARKGDYRRFPVPSYYRLVAA